MKQQSTEALRSEADEVDKYKYSFVRPRMQLGKVASNHTNYTQNT